MLLPRFDTLAAMLDAAATLAFIEAHGAVLVAGKGLAPRLVEAIVGGPIRGSWWAHSKSHEIFAVLSQVERSGDLLMCRLIDGKVTLVHRRLWPALVRLEYRFPRPRLAQIHQQHTASGKHVNRLVPFPEWVPESVRSEAAHMSEEAAVQALHGLLRCDPAIAAARRRRVPSRRSLRATRRRSRS
jgi:hypothetical protein